MLWIIFAQTTQQWANDYVRVLSSRVVIVADDGTGHIDRAYGGDGNNKLIR